MGASGNARNGLSDSLERHRSAKYVQPLPVALFVLIALSFLKPFAAVADPLAVNQLTGQPIGHVQADHIDPDQIFGYSVFFYRRGESADGSSKGRWGETPCSSESDCQRAIQEDIRVQDECLRAWAENPKVCGSADYVYDNHIIVALVRPGASRSADQLATAIGKLQAANAFMDKVDHILHDPSDGPFRTRLERALGFPEGSLKTRQLFSLEYFDALKDAWTRADQLKNALSGALKPGSEQIASQMSAINDDLQTIESAESNIEKQYPGLVEGPTPATASPQPLPAASLNLDSGQERGTGTHANRENASEPAASASPAMPAPRSTPLTEPQSTTGTTGPGASRATNRSGGSSGPQARGNATDRRTPPPSATRGTQSPYVLPPPPVTPYASPTPCGLYQPNGQCYGQGGTAGSSKRPTSAGIPALPFGPGSGASASGPGNSRYRPTVAPTWAPSQSVFSRAVSQPVPFGPPSESRSNSSSAASHVIPQQSPTWSPSQSVFAAPRSGTAVHGSSNTTTRAMSPTTSNGSFGYGSASGTGTARHQGTSSINGNVFSRGMTQRTTGPSAAVHSSNVTGSNIGSVNRSAVGGVNRTSQTSPAHTLYRSPTSTYRAPAAQPQPAYRPAPPPPVYHPAPVAPAPVAPAPVYRAPPPPVVAPQPVRPPPAPAHT